MKPDTAPTVSSSTNDVKAPSSTVTLTSQVASDRQVPNQAVLPAALTDPEHSRPSTRRAETKQEFAAPKELSSLEKPTFKTAATTPIAANTNSTSLLSNLVWDSENPATRPSIEALGSGFGEPTVVGAPAVQGTTAPVAQTPQMTSAGPVQQVLAQILIAENKTANGTFEVRLEPEELGKVRLSFATRETGLVVTVVAERPETLDLLRRNSGELHLGLSDMNFGDAVVEFSDGRGESTTEWDEDIDDRNERRIHEVTVSINPALASADDRLDIRL